MKGIPVNGEAPNTLGTKRIKFVHKHATEFHLKLADRLWTEYRRAQVCYAQELHFNPTSLRLGNEISLIASMKRKHIGCRER